MAGNPGKPEPPVEFAAVEGVRILERRARRQIESDHTLQSEEVADFIAGQYLGHRTLTPEEALAALHRFGIAFLHVDGKHVTHRLRSDSYRRVAVAGDVLDPGAQGVGVLHADNGAVVTHPQ